MEGGAWRTTEVRLAAALAVVVAGVRLALAHPLQFCGTPDACYYLGMAQSLSTGHGFHARFLYDYQLPHPTLPNTGIEYWRPGISLVLALLRPLGGVTLHSSIALTVLVGVVYATAAWHIAVRSGGGRRLALLAFALCLLSSPAWTGSLTPDSGLYYGAAVAWFLALFTVRRQGLLADVLALGCVSIAYLVRNDAALLLLPLLAVLWQRRRLAEVFRTDGTIQPAGASLPYAVAILAGFLLALAPMHLLYRGVLGNAFPSGTAKVFFLNSLDDFERFHAPVSLQTLLATGLKHQVVFRAGTLATILYRIAVLMIGYPALVFWPGLFGRSRTRTVAGPAGAIAGSMAGTDSRWPELTGPVAFLLTVLLIYGLVLPAVGGFSALRSAVGVMPLAAVLTVVAVYRVARTPRLALLLAAAAVAANGLSGLMDDRRDVAAANALAAADRAEAEALMELGADPATAVVLTADPVQFSVTTGYATASLPRNGLDAIADAARELGATHVMLNTEDLPAAVGVLNLRLHPLRSVELGAEHTLILALPPSRGAAGGQR